MKLLSLQIFNGETEELRVLILHIQENHADIYYRSLVGAFQHAASAAFAGRRSTAGFQRQSFESLARSLSHPAEDALSLPNHGGRNYCEVAQGGVLQSNPSTYQLCIT